MRTAATFATGSDARPEAGPIAEPVYFYLPNLGGGGAERVFVRLANALALTGVPVTLVVGSACGPLLDILDPSVTLRDLRAERGYQVLPRLARLLRRDAPPVLFSALTGANVTAVAAARIAGRGTRVVVSERNHFSSLIARSPRLRRLFLGRAVRIAYPRAHAVTAVAGGVAGDIARVAGLPDGAVTVICNPAPDADEIAAARAAPAPHPWFDDPIPVLVAAGRLRPQKDYPTLLRAVARLDRPARLVILGDGPDLAALQALAAELGIAERVHFAGFCMNRFDYMVRARVFVLSSLLEGFPNALIEAVSCGVPVVSTDCAGHGPREILSALHPRALVPVDDPAALAAAIARELDAPVAAATLARIAARYSTEAVLEAYLAQGRP